MKFTGFKVANCLRVNYPDGIIYAEIADDQDPLLLAMAAEAERSNDCELPPELGLRWTGGESRMAVRLVDSEVVGETTVFGDFAGLGWQVEASYVEEGKHCWTVLAEGADQEGVEKICAGLNDLLDGHRQAMLKAAAGLRSKAAVMRNPTAAAYHDPAQILEAAARELEAACAAGSTS